MGVLSDLQDSVVAQLEAHVERAMLPFILRSAMDDRDDDGAAAAREAGAAVEALDLTEMDALRPKATKALTAAGKLGAADGVAIVKLAVPDAEDFEIPNDVVVSYAETRAAELVGKRVLADGSVIDNPNPQFAITEGTRELLRGTITQAFQEQWTRPQLREALEDHYAFSRQRADTIARTEISKALIEGNAASVAATGLDALKESLLGSEHDDDDECEVDDS
jgi:hypothetical protein